MSSPVNTPELCSTCDRPTSEPAGFCSNPSHTSFDGRPQRDRERTPDERVSPKGKCPDCHKTVRLERQLDGYARPMNDRPYRVSFHAGNRWGRPCRGSNELYTGDEP